MRHVVLFGPPAAGKGTQAALLAQKTGMSPASTGDMLRAAVSEGTPLGKRADQIMKAGDLVDDATVVGIIADYLATVMLRDGVLFDGFPRTVAQAEALDALLAERGDELVAVINIVVPDEILMSRVESRLSQTPPEQRRADDTPEALQVRLQNYHAQTLPVLEYYQSSGKVRDIKGDDSIEQVSANILALL